MQYWGNKMTNRSIKEPFVLKIVVVGDKNTKKTKLLRTYIYGKQENRLSFKGTIGVDIHTIMKEFDIKKVGRIKIHIAIFELASDLRFSDVRSEFYKGAKGAIVCFDMDKENTLFNTRNWVNEILDNLGKIPVVLVGCIDNSNNKKIPIKAVQSVIKELESLLGYSLPYIEISITSPSEMDKVFEKLVEMIINRLIQER